VLHSISFVFPNSTTSCFRVSALLRLSLRALAAAP